MSKDYISNGRNDSVDMKEILKQCMSCDGKHLSGRRCLRACSPIDIVASYDRLSSSRMGKIAVNSNGKPGIGDNWQLIFNRIGLKKTPTNHAGLHDKEGK